MIIVLCLSSVQLLMVHMYIQKQHTIDFVPISGDLHLLPESLVTM